MIKIKKVEISGIRGASLPLKVDFVNDCRSIAIFGDNASGKSTLSDALEWFCYGRVEHLRREDCGLEALRNLKIDPEKDAEVSLEFNDPKISCCKTLPNNLKEVLSPTSPEITGYFEATGKERLILRNADLLGFVVVKNKSEKREEIFKIIGYEVISNFREVINTVLRRLGKDPAYTGLTKSMETLRKEMIEIIGKIVENENELFHEAENIASGAKVEVKIYDFATYEKILEEMSKSITSGEKGEKRASFSNLKSILEGINAIMSEIIENKAFFAAYQELIKDKQKVNQIDLREFLDKGKNVVERKLIVDEVCPLCLKPTDREKLLSDLADRLVALEQIQVEYEDNKLQRDFFSGKLKEAINRINTVANYEEFLDKVFVDNLNGYKDELTNLSEDLDKKFVKLEPLTKNPEATEKIFISIVSNISAKIEDVAKTVQSLLETETERVLFDAFEKMKGVKEKFLRVREEMKKRDVYQMQIASLQKIRDMFVEVQNTTLQNILDQMSEDISKYYLTLHPVDKEKVDNIRLKIVGEEGVEFEYSFHGYAARPPAKYLSESHLNSLGISLFLASVKLFNSVNGFFVLDDVVTSLDKNHRSRLIELLKNEFSDYQIILLTHESSWFKILKRTFEPFGWLTKQMDWSFENGVELKKPIIEQRELIEYKMNEGLPVGNDLRILLEDILKQICCNLEVKLAFRYDDTNEDRMCGELLSELRGTLNKKNKGIKDDPIFKTIESSIFVTSKASHDSNVEIAPGDIEVVLENINRLENVFLCSECGYVSRKYFNTIEKKITCKCGQKVIDWED